MAMRTTTHKIRLNPTPEQEASFRCAAGTRRFCFNWGLAEWNRQETAYQEEQQVISAADRNLERPNAMALKQQFNAIREAEFPWTYDVTKCAIEGAFFDLKDAFERYFAGQNQHPKFKKKGKSHESFYLANDKFTFGAHWVQIPVMGDFILKQREANGAQTEKIKNRTNYKRKLGRVNMAENLRFRVSPAGAGCRSHGQLYSRALVHQHSSEDSRAGDNEHQSDCWRGCGDQGVGSRQ